MTTIKVLAAAGDWVAGTVVTIDEKQAERLIRTGYAEPMPMIDELHVHESRAVVDAMTDVKRTRSRKAH